MTAFSLRRHVAKETALSVAVNLLIATVPGVLLAESLTDPVRTPVGDFAVASIPQFFMAALMSALVPSLLTWRKQRKGQLGPDAPRLRPDHALWIALALAAASTIVVLALIHLVAAPLAAGGIGTEAVLTLRSAQAALAGATVTPCAILLLWETGDYGSSVS